MKVDTHTHTPDNNKNRKSSLDAVSPQIKSLMILSLKFSKKNLTIVTRHCVNSVTLLEVYICS